MAQQEGGWPLRLQPLNVRAGLIRNADSYGSTSFNTLLSGSPTSSSTDSSSDLDTESTGSFFHDRRTTLGSLIGITSIPDLSSRSLRSRRQDTIRGRKGRRGRIWFSLCAKAHVIERDPASAAPSLGHFLEVERRATNSVSWRSRTPVTYELDGWPEAAQPVQEANSLFSNGCIAPPPRSSDDGDLYRATTGSGMIQLRFPCLRGAAAAS